MLCMVFKVELSIVGSLTSKSTVRNPHRLPHALFLGLLYEIIKALMLGPGSRAQRVVLQSYECAGLVVRRLLTVWSGFPQECMCPNDIYFCRGSRVQGSGDVYGFACGWLLCNHRVTWRVGDLVIR